MSQGTIVRVQQILQQFSAKLDTKLLHPSETVELNATEVRKYFYNLSRKEGEVTQQLQLQIVLNVGNGLKNFINVYLKDLLRITDLSDSHKLLSTMSRVWDLFKKFTFGMEFITYAFRQRLGGLHRMKWSYSVNHLLAKPDIIKPVTPLALYYLKMLLEQFSLFDKLPDAYNKFIKSKRIGKAVEQDLIKQCMNCVESCYYNNQAGIMLDSSNTPQIYKQPNSQIKDISLKAKDQRLFKDKFEEKMFISCETYWSNEVHSKIIKMTATEQITHCLQLIEIEKEISKNYVSNFLSRSRYMEVVYKGIIQTKLEERIKKQDGLKTYLNLYNPQTGDYQKQLQNFWKLYKLIHNLSVPIIINIYKAYMDEEGLKAGEKILKPIDHINEIIRINTKSLKIVDIFSRNFNIQNQRNISLSLILSNQNRYEKKKPDNKPEIGADNLAYFVHNIFKQAYKSAGMEKVNEVYDKIIKLVRLIGHPQKFIQEHSKYLAQRLTEEIDFNRINQFQNSTENEKRFNTDLQNIVSALDILPMKQNIIDINKSQNQTKKLEDAIEKAKNKELKGDFCSVNQIIVKNQQNWPYKFIYEIEHPPSVLAPICTWIEKYFKQSDKHIRFELYNGVSQFQGNYNSEVPKQRFLMKNIYLIILLLIDQQQKKSILFGRLKDKIKSIGSYKDRGSFQLIKNIIELLWSGLIFSTTKVIDLSKIDLTIGQSDQFCINTKFNYEQELKKQKRPAKSIKKVSVLKTIHVTNLPNQLKNGIARLQQKLDTNTEYENQKRLLIRAKCIKTLKQAHEHKTTTTLDQLIKACQDQQLREFRVDRKYLKGIIETLINEDYCQRKPDSKETFEYIT